MVNYFETILPGQTIGIIGGGQLGRMMGLAAKEAGFKIAVLDPAMDSPCGQMADIRIVAPYNDEAALEELGEVSDVITYEFENIDYEGLKGLGKSQMYHKALNLSESHKTVSMKKQK